MHRRSLLAGLALGPTAALPRPGLAQGAAGGWRPSRPVTMLVPFAAGGPTDVMARLLALRMSERLGRPIAVENVGSAGGIVGTQRLARATPDGHTFGLGHMGTHAANLSFYRRLPYDPVADFEPIGQYATNPMILGVNPSVAGNAQELLAWIAAHPGQMMVANAGNGSVSYLGALLFDRVFQAKATLVPYRGAGPALQDTVNGVTHAVVDQALTVIPQAQSGGLKGICVTVPRRLPQLPDLPSSAEIGKPEFDIAVWNGAFVPKGTPPEIVRSLAATLSETLDDALIRERFATLAVEIPPAAERGPEPLRRLIASEIVRWRQVAADAGVTPE
ncbi:tripartite tricarboxylate transporter substrate binding protein BugD [Roseomonas sp. OT10]|uniref:Bug family tripartite tricarboxylate transporter substrate binding protein n=1 Tax=Roseomonas cutis TaxID=2897332 RepID=UPI001E2E6341|nr:tripartite tricarboxylate transporter substrate-binding protein [Roseomonas sp. OT10]UFN48391.1 tripartite tricarboxylate transporter substrate binding protein BugD [Roseomonas sp. OT10]